MFWNRLRLALGIGFAMWLLVLAPPALAETKMSKHMEVQADQKDVSAILAVFDQAETALKTQDLRALMALYSKDFHYQGLKKDDLKRIWTTLFTRYHRMTSHHIFSKIAVVNGTVRTAEVTCTGGLWATSDSTGERVNIDSWFEEVHRLVYEDGTWRILGHAGEDPGNTQLGSAHPFF